MAIDTMRTSNDFGSRMTRLGKRLLLIYGIIYVLELLFEHWFDIPIVSSLLLYPLKHPNFHFWQLFSHPFLHDPRSPLGFLISCVVFYFFIGPVENHFGARRFLIFFYTSALGALLIGTALSGVAEFNAPFSGMLPSLLSMIVVFGFLNPEATILLMFVLPIKAKYLSYGTILITFLTFLAKANPNGAYHLGGILFGYIYLKGFGNLLNVNFAHRKYLEWQLKKRKSRFTVIDGAKGKKNKDGPTYH